MTNLTVFNGSNSQEIALDGLVDQSGAAVSDAAITATLTRAGAVLANSDMAFAPVAGSPGNYTAMLDDFDAPPGSASMLVRGSDAGATFNFTLFVTVANRTL